MTELEVVIALLIAAFLGGTVGLQRGSVGKSAGTRTMALVAMGSALFTLVSMYGFGSGDPGRVASQILTGMGFIGAGTIIHKRSSSTVEGLTTAAALWAVSAIGIAVGVGWYTIAFLATIVTVLVLMFNDDAMEGRTRK